MDNLETYFDTPFRSPKEEIEKEILALRDNSIIYQLLEGYRDLALIINKNRELIAFNSKAMEAFRVNDYREIIGKRLGEAIHCIHSSKNEAGCGTSVFCKECGAARAIMKTNNNGIAAEEECRITALVNEHEVSLDYSVYTHPIKIDDHIYTMFAVKNISDEKRREALEKIFFHDVLNTAGALKGLSQMLSNVSDEEERIELIKVVQDTSKQLVNEIAAQQALSNAEDGNLQTVFNLYSANTIIFEIHELYKNNELSAGKILEIEKLPFDIKLVTDSTLLLRSIGNLLKNALEVSDKNDLIRIYCKDENEEISFNILNNKLIPKNVQLQLFQRSFSTKQKKGRGLGLYSVKLIVEQYLHGKVSFISNEIDNTIFTIKLPKEISK